MVHVDSAGGTGAPTPRQLSSLALYGLANLYSVFLPCLCHNVVGQPRVASQGGTQGAQDRPHCTGANCTRMQCRCPSRSRAPPHARLPVRARMAGFAGMSDAAMLPCCKSPFSSGTARSGWSSAHHCASNTCSMIDIALSCVPRRFRMGKRSLFTSKCLSRSSSSVDERSSGERGIR